MNLHAARRRESSMPSPTQLGQPGPELLKSVTAVLQTPGNAVELLRLSALLNAGRGTQAKAGRDPLVRALSWFSAAATCVGEAGTDLVARNAGLVTRLLQTAGTQAHRSATVERICRLFPERPEFWLLAASARAGAGDAPGERLALRRALVLDPNRPGGLIRLAVSQFRDEAIDNRLAAIPARRAIILRPDLSDAHRALGGILLDGLEIDVPAPPALRNSLRRWALLEGDTASARPALEGAFRKIGDIEGLKRVGEWTRLQQATGHGAFDQGPRVALDTFAAEVAGLAPFILDTDFEARVFAGRVLLHPKLPDDGTWRLNGPADQSERAVRVLRHYNPRATVLLPDAPPDAPGNDARTLSLVPCEDPDAWYLPCLWGHPHIWWTVLPAILDAGSEPDLERALSFALRTGQNITFWTGDAKARAHIAANTERGRRIADRMGDRASRDGYLETMAADRPTFLRRFFTEAGHRAQYFDYAVYRPGDVILSMGVAEGFEIPAYLALIAPGGDLHNIDPDGHGRLGAPARAWIDPAWLAKTGCAVHVHPVAISDVDGEIQMQTGGHWEDSRLSRRPAHQMTTLASKRLDTLIAEQGLAKIDHIKLDIEGGEGFVLDQVIAVMNSHRPQIEISIYHTPEQFFDIPERMMNEADDYRFYFHHYSGQFAEATLYAIPAEIEPLMPIKP